MAGYNYNLKSIIQGAKQVASSEMLIPARVVDVILDSSHPEFEKYGKWSAIGAIKYRALSRQLEENTTADLPVAYPMQAHIKHIPLKNEIVLITASPSELLSESSNSTKNYYLDIVNLWNHPHHNAFPSNIDEDVSLGADFEEAADINPMLPFEGDVIFEGRQGQSIRFSTNIKDKTPWQAPISAPIIVISNGQIHTDNGFEFIKEDINVDSTSIYLTSNQGIDFKLAREYSITSLDSCKYYDKSQLLGNSDRIVLNAKTDSIHLLANTQIGLLGNQLYLESSQNTTLESARINLGDKANESVLLGDTTIQYITPVMTQLIALATGLSSIGIPQVTAPAQELLRVTTKFLTATQSMKSQKVKVAK